MGVSVGTWLSTHVDLASLIMPRGNLENVMKSKGAWKSVAADVRALMRDTETGQVVFSFASDMLASTELETVIQQGLAAVVAAQFSEVSISEFRQGVDVTVNLFEAKGLPQKRNISFDTFGTANHTTIAAPKSEA